MGGSGFPLHHVLSDNVSEFTCKICSEFCEQPVVTLCENKHIFCLACLDEWFRNGDAKCPTCQEQMSYGTDARYESLKEHSPVLSRVYEKVCVRCPMDDACDWIGSCSEITRHMTSTDAHKKKTTSKTSKTTTTTKTTRGSGDAKKEENDDTADGLQKQALNKFEAKQYRDAVQLCSKCLSIEKDSAKALHLRGRCW